MSQNVLEKKLEKRYSELFKNEINSRWAVKKKSDPKKIVSPSIPFIGKNYDDLKILLYASAENLTYYKDEEEQLDNDKIAINRHRYCFEKSSKEAFFPFVHIGPVQNGALLLIMAYLIKKVKNKRFSDPYKLIENIAVANFGKFSIKSEDKNIDYPGDIEKLEKSLRYIKSDIEILKPEIVILPKTIFNHKVIKDMLENELPDTTFIPIMQITPTTINGHMNKYHKKNIPRWLKDWHEELEHSGNIKGKLKDNYYSVYDYLDKVLEDI